MTPEQEMQAIVESAGECWHESAGCAPLYKCKKCGRQMGYHTCNPSPTDLNELFRLAEKLGVYAGNWKIDDYGCCHILVETNDLKRKEIVTNDTPADALRNALYQAVTKGEG